MLPFGLVRLRTFRLAHGLVRGKHECRCSRAHGGDVSFRDVTIETPDRNVTAGCDWRHAPEACAEDLGDLKKKSVSRVLAYEEDGWLSELAEALRRVPHVMKGWLKSRHKRLCLSLPHVEKPFNWKVIKSSVAELRSRKVFLVSGFLCYLYMGYEHSISISHTSWYLTMLQQGHRHFAQHPFHCLSP